MTRKYDILSYLGGLSDNYGLAKKNSIAFIKALPEDAMLPTSVWPHPFGDITLQWCGDEYRIGLRLEKNGDVSLRTETESKPDKYNDAAMTNISNLLQAVKNAYPTP